MSDLDDDDDIKCALSGAVPADEDLVDDADDDDDLGETPIGWLKITVKRRGVNPVWVEVQAMKQAIVDQIIAGYGIPADVPQAQKDAVLRSVTIQTDAQWAAYERDIDKYVTVEDVRYVRDPDSDKQVAEAWGQIATALDDIDVSGRVEDAAEGEDEGSTP